MISYHKLLPHEAAELKAHLCRLDPQERGLRFFASVNDGFINRHVDGIDWDHATVVGAFRAGHLVGAAELLATAEGAELAVSVDHDIQHEGVGTELVGRALLAARNRGIRHVTVEYLSRNNPIRRIAARFKPQLHAGGGGIVADITVPTPNNASLLREIAGEAWGWFWDFADRLTFHLPAKTG